MNSVSLKFEVLKLLFCVKLEGGEVLLHVKLELDVIIVVGVVVHLPENIAVKIQPFLLRNSGVLAKLKFPGHKLPFPELGDQ